MKKMLQDLYMSYWHLHEFLWQESSFQMILFSLQTFVKEFGVTMVSHHSLFMYFVVYCGFLNLFLLH